jgi:hypothetical protein
LELPLLLRLLLLVRRSPCRSRLLCWRDSLLFWRLLLLLHMLLLGLLRLLLHGVARTCGILAWHWPDRQHALRKRPAVRRATSKRPQHLPQDCPQEWPAIY